MLSQLWSDIFGFLQEKGKGCWSAVGVSILTHAHTTKGYAKRKREAERAPPSFSFFYFLIMVKVLIRNYFTVLTQAPLSSKHTFEQDRGISFLLLTCDYVLKLLVNLAFFIQNRFSTLISWVMNYAVI